MKKDTGRSLNVCQACTRRKRACSKARPTCAFCAQRGLVCRYEAPRHRAYHPGRHFVALPERAVTSLAPSTDESTDRKAWHAAKLNGWTHEAIVERYLATVHDALPIIAPGALRRDVLRYEQSTATPTDYSVLLLAMLLSILPLEKPRAETLSDAQARLYIAAKAALAQAQTACAVSLRILQANILLAMREYTSGRPKTAYVSICTCIGMARMLGIGIESVRTSASSPNSRGGSDDHLERENIAWAIAMVERLVLAELPDHETLLPLTKYPSAESLLPCSLSPSGPECTDLASIVLSDLNAPLTSRFGRQAQAIFLLDQLLNVTRCTTTSPDTKLAALTALDIEIRTLLQNIIGEPRWKSTRTCVPGGLCVRSTLALLSAPSSRPTQAEARAAADIHADTDTHAHARARAHAALDASCGMVRDVVRYALSPAATARPSCCFYSLRAAEGYLIETKQKEGELSNCDGDEQDDVVDGLRCALEGYSRAWVFGSE